MIETPDEILRAIDGLQPSFAAKSKELGTMQNTSGPRVSWTTNGILPDYWRCTFMTEACDKLSSLIANRPSRPETLWTLAATRYVFEIKVWFKLVHKDPRFALLFFSRLINDQEDHLNQLIKNADREIALFRRVAADEESLTVQSLGNLAAARLEGDSLRAAVSEAMKFMESKIDNEVRRSFSIYRHDAKRNGYSFEAYLIETQAKPEAEEELRKIRDEKNCFNELDLGTRKFVDDWRRWNWKKASGLVGMGEQHDYIYNYVSRCLHASPVSIISRKEIGDDERLIFLDFMHISLVDCLEMANNSIKSPEDSSKTHKE